MKKLFYSLLLVLFLTPNIKAQSLSKIQKAKQFLQAEELSGDMTADDFLISDMYTDTDGNTFVYFNQAIDGIPIYNAITPIVIGRQGNAYNAGDRIIADAEKLIESKSDNIGAERALRFSAEALGVTGKNMPTMLRSDVDGAVVFGPAEFAHNEIKMSKKYYFDGEKIRLGYSVDLDLVGTPDYYSVIIDAKDGKVLSKHNYLVSCNLHKDSYTIGHKNCGAVHAAEANVISAHKSAMLLAGEATYNVYPLPYESPAHGPQEMVQNPHFTDSSPFGWHDTNGQEGAEYTTTRGNNVHAYLDTDNDDLPDGAGPEGGDDLVFDFPYDASLEPEENGDLAQTNLFYMVNMFHDITARLGFDEAAGNFQQKNYSGAGQGNDYVLAQALDGFKLDEPTLNNANFSTPPDGGNGRMQMFLWERPSGEVFITEPTELEGFIVDYGTANFGPGIPILDADPVEGKIALAYDGSSQLNTDACQTIINPDDIKDKVALVDRGTCNFIEKVANCQEAGSIAVIVCNIVGAGGDGEEVINMGSPDDYNGPAITIPSIMIPKSNCDAIKASLLSDIDVSVYLKQREIEGNRYLDGSLDNGIIAHENGHGISTRLVGGPSASGCLTSEEQSGEGISDFFTLLLTTPNGTTRDLQRGIGNYATDKSPEGRGIRDYPFSTDMNVNPLTYEDLLTINTGNAGFIYNVGEIWTSMLFEMYWNFVDKYGLDDTWENEESGNFKTGRLVVAGLASQPCNASFIEARDAILMADSLLYNGENAALIWNAFAKRGLGYKATDEGGNSISDGTASFEPFPLVVEKLKIDKAMKRVVDKGDIIDVSLAIANHVNESKTGVSITDQIPEGMQFVEGSASITAEMQDDNTIIFNLGDLDYKDEMSVTYQLEVLDEIKSQSLFYEDIEELREIDWDREAIEGTDRWEIVYEAPTKSGEAAWYMEEVDAEIDQVLVMPNFNVVGERPVLKFWHRYETEAGNDGGFIQVSTDDGETWQNLNDKFLRNGYNHGIAYGTFAIPSLEGFSGSTDNEYIDSYIDLSDYKDQWVRIRYRFGTNETVKVDDDFAGWLLDDFELIDLQSAGTVACIASDAGDDEQCTEAIEVFFNPEEKANAVEDLTNIHKVQVYPNPVSEVVSIQLEGDRQESAVLSLKDLLGRTVDSQPIEITGRKQIRSFDVSSFSAGTYFVELRTASGVTAQKLIVQ